MVDKRAQEVEQVALRLLAGREYSREELRRRLALRTSDGDLLDRLLDALEAQQLLSDARFAEQYIESRRRKGFGPIRIRSELAERGIDAELIASSLDERDPIWWKQLQAVANGKFGTGQSAEFKEQAKRARFLEYRGFSPAQIRRFLWP